MSVLQPQLHCLPSERIPHKKDYRPDATQTTAVTHLDNDVSRAQLAA